ncbi:MAG: DUF502 domain-containing protein [Rhodobacteraceae bacterium]|nr:DUF502 domain-containing protein [Paracoccaceae bacterium]
MNPNSAQWWRTSSLLASLRANFLTGLVVVAPAGLTIIIVWTVISAIDSRILPLLPPQFNPNTYINIGWEIPGFGLIIFLFFTVIIGYFTKVLLGRTLLRWIEFVVTKTPVIRTVYNAIKHIAETVISQSNQSFDRACLIEYPRQGIWAVAFFSSYAKGEIEERSPDGETIISVFLPTTPNPTSGFLLFVNEDDVVWLNMTVEDAAKLVISAGLVYPKT